MNKQPPLKVAYNPTRHMTIADRPSRYKTMNHTNDFLASQHYAEAHAMELDRWWAKHGYPLAQHHAVPVTLGRNHDSHSRAFGVRCNLINGIPPGHALYERVLAMAEREAAKKAVA